MFGIERMHGYHRGQHGVRLGRVVIHLIGNCGGAPLVDDAWVTTGDGRRWHGKCLSLVLRRDRYGARLGGFALFVGWQERRAMAPAHATAGGMEPGA